MERRTYLGFVMPSVVVMTVLMVIPFVTTVWLSLTDLNLRDLDSAPFIGFDNYTEIFKDSRFHSALRFTLIFVAVIVPAQLVLGLGVALLLDRVTRGRAEQRLGARVGHRGDPLERDRLARRRA